MNARQREDADRRITERDSPLKEIAGRIQKLSFRDMREFARQMDPDASEQKWRELAEQILDATDRILEHSNGH